MTKHTPEFIQPQFEFPKLCECGCGQPAPISKRNNPQFGHVKGEPVRFICGHNGDPSRPIEQRFWAKVDKTDDCWLWTGSIDACGYGSLRSGKDTIRAHRFAYELHDGPIPEGMEICHSCDRPACVNWAHLWLGTHRENMDDMFRKNRRKAARLFGETNHSAKLTENTVLDIRARAANGVRRIELAQEFGVCKGAIDMIVQGKTWTHLLP